MRDAFVESWFGGALAFADDLVLLSPTASAMHRKLSIGDDFSSKLFMIFKFNAMRISRSVDFSFQYVSIWFEICYSILSAITLSSMLMGGHIYAKSFVRDATITALLTQYIIISVIKHYICYHIAKMSSMINDRYPMVMMMMMMMMIQLICSSSNLRCIINICIIISIIITDH